MTYDLVDLSDDHLLNLLGDEFKLWDQCLQPSKLELEKD
jgi:hypothetical protein